MDAEHAAVLLPLLALVVGGGVVLALIAVMDDARTRPRDLVHEHQLGAHRQMPAWGCPMCEKR